MEVGVELLFRVLFATNLYRWLLFSFQGSVERVQLRVETSQEGTLALNSFTFNQLSLSVQENA